MPSLVPHPDQVRLELGRHRRHVERPATDRSGRVADRSADTQPHVLRRQLGEDVASVYKRPCQPVQLGDDQRVFGPACRQCEA
jgi:hypothetical protein